MHPEVRQKGPGSCPICGMALEPVDAAHVEERNVELEDMTRRFFVSLVLTAIPRSWSRSCCRAAHSIASSRMACATGSSSRSRLRCLVGRSAVLPAGMGVDRQSLSQYVHAHRIGRGSRIYLQRGRRPGAWPLFDSFRMGGEVAVYFEPAAVIVVLVLLGQVLELRARRDGHGDSGACSV